MPHGLLFLISSKGSLYASSQRQDNTNPSLCYTSRGAGMRNSSIGPPWGIDPTTHRSTSEYSYHRATSHSTSRIVNNKQNACSIQLYKPLMKMLNVAVSVETPSCSRTTEYLASSAMRVFLMSRVTLPLGSAEMAVRVSSLNSRPARKNLTAGIGLPFRSISTSTCRVSPNGR